MTEHQEDKFDEQEMQLLKRLEAEGWVFHTPESRRMAVDAILHP